MMNPINSYVNLPGEKILGLSQALIRSMASYGLTTTFQVEKLMKANETLYEKFCTQAKDNFKELNDRYPGIVNAILKSGSDFDLKRLARYIGLAEKLERGEIEEFDVCVEVSTELRNEFVLGKLGKKPEDMPPVDRNFDPEKLKSFTKSINLG